MVLQVHLFFHNHTKKKTIKIKQLKGRINYVEALNKMNSKVLEVSEDIKNEEIWFLEHQSVFTAGSSTPKNFNQKKKELSNNLTQQKKKEIVQLINKINPILEEYMKANSIDFILSKQGVYLSKTSYDITQEILEIVNKKIK